MLCFRALKLSVIIVVAIAGAGAQAAPLISVVGAADGCPSATAVAAVLRTLTPGEVVDAPRANAFTVELFDEEDALRVVTPCGERRFEEAQRRCDERARAAGVFIALTLAESCAPAARPPAAPPPPPRTARLRATLELAILVDGAPRSAPDNSQVTGGAVLKLGQEARIGAALVGGFVSASGEGPVTAHYPSAHAGLERIPFEVGVRAGGRHGRVEVDGNLALVLDTLLVTGQGLSSDKQAQRLELAIGVGALLRVWSTDWFAPTLSFDVLIAPNVYQVVVAPSQVVGTLPQVWLSAALGVAVRID